MPRRQQIEGGTKNKILEVGRRMFFENGFDGTGVRAIMREVGLDVGAFYYYFKTKDELFDAIMAACRILEAEETRTAVRFAQG